MSYKISKELLCEVLDKDKRNITKIKNNQSKTIVEYEQFERYWGAINIYELAHKCKEWAFDKFNYEIYTSTTYGYVLNEENNLVHESISLESEQQYCFDACQWILDKAKQ